MFLFFVLSDSIVVTPEPGFRYGCVVIISEFTPWTPEPLDTDSVSVEKKDMTPSTQNRHHIQTTNLFAFWSCFFHFEFHSRQTSGHCPESRLADKKTSHQRGKMDKLLSAYPISLCVTYLVTRLASAGLASKNDRRSYTDKPWRRRIGTKYIGYLHVALCLSLATTASITCWILASDSDSRPRVSWPASSDYLVSTSLTS